MGEFLRGWRIELAFVAACLIGTGCLPGFPTFTESTGQSYAQYKSKYLPEFDPRGFDPKGASNIFYRSSGTRDGYDEWWKLTMSQSDYASLVRVTAKIDHGPDKIEFSSAANPPSNWNPESQLPPWWCADRVENPQSFYWCFSAGNAERHHGYFFVYDPESKTARCWHWNHQWSSSECTEPSNVSNQKIPPIGPESTQ